MARYKLKRIPLYVGRPVVRWEGQRRKLIYGGQKCRDRERNTILLSSSRVTTVFGEQVRTNQEICPLFGNSHWYKLLAVPNKNFSPPIPYSFLIHVWRGFELAGAPLSKWITEIDGFVAVGPLWRDQCLSAFRRSFTCKSEKAYINFWCSEKSTSASIKIVVNEISRCTKNFRNRKICRCKPNT